MDNSCSTTKVKPLDEIFIGRDEQIEMICFEHDKLLKNNIGIVTISGTPGVGKTYLVLHALNRLGVSTYYYGKYRDNDKQTLTAIADVLEQITSAAATFAKKSFDNILNELNKNIGEDLTLLASICPEMIIAFDIKKTINIENFNKLKYRIRNAVFNFILIMSKYIFPLIIYLDDLQWADELSLDIIRTLVSKKDTLNIMLIVSFRPSEMEEKTNKLTGLLKSKSSYINLENLSSENIDDYLKLVFNNHMSNKELLSKLLIGFTQGNPFYIKELLNILLGEKVIQYSEKSKEWEFITEGINSFLLNENMELLLKNRIQTEMHNNGYLLELISCLDGQADYDLVKSIYNIDEVQLADYINRLVDTAIIIRQKSKNKNSLMFSHDIMYRLIYNNIPNVKKSIIHYNIAKTIWTDSNINLSEKNNFIVSHLIRCNAEDVSDNLENWINLLYEVGYSEKNKASIDAALVIFEYAQRLIKRLQSIDDLFYVKLHLELAECLFLYNREEECSAIMDLLESEFRATEEKIAIKRKQIYIYQYKRDHKMVLKTGADILKYLKFSFGTYRLPIDLLRSMYVYRASKLESIVEAPKVTDDELLLIIQVLTLMNVSAALTNDRLTAPIGLSAALVAARSGSSGDSLIGYSSYCYVQYLILKDYKNAEKFADTIAKISEESSILENKSVVYFLLGGYLSHWCKNLMQADNYLEKSIYFGERAGDFAFVGYSIATSVTTKFSMGMRLEYISTFIEKCKTSYPEMDQYVTKYVFDVTLQHINDMKYGFSDYDYEKIASKYQLLTPLETISEEEIMFHKMLFMNKVSEGYQLAEIVTPKIKISQGLLSSMELLFNSTLFRILMHNHLEVSEYSKNLRIVKRQIKKIKYWVDIYKENYYSRYILLLAEYKILISNDSSGAELFNEAILNANENDNLYIEAVSCVLAARYYKDNEKLCKFYARECIKALKKWDADFLSEQIEEEFQITYEKETAQFFNEEVVDNLAYSDICITGFYEKTQTMDENDTIRYLLQEILKNNCADYSAVIYENNDELFLKHEAGREKKVKTYSQSVNISYISSLAHKVIRYAYRTSKDVIVDSENISRIFASDVHIAGFERIYIACIPIIYHDLLIGILYLEKYDMPIENEKLLIIKSLLPAAISKQSEIKNINIKSIFSSQKNQELLTKRELEVLKLISEGLSNHEIAEELSITLGTTKKHISSILMKLGTGNRIKAIIKAKDLNLL